MPLVRVSNGGSPQIVGPALYNNNQQWHDISITGTFSELYFISGLGFTAESAGDLKVKLNDQTVYSTYYGRYYGYGLSVYHAVGNFNNPVFSYWQQGTQMGYFIVAF